MFVLEDKMRELNNFTRSIKQLILLYVGDIWVLWSNRLGLPVQYACVMGNNFVIAQCINEQRRYFQVNKAVI